MHMISLPSTMPVRPATIEHLQHGFTLLEILVSIVILSIGLLGLAGLQAVSLSNNQIAYYRAIATQQAYDMADRIRSNLAGVNSGAYNNMTATIPTSPDCLTAACNAGNMAISDHALWNTNNQRLLPAGRGTVTSTDSWTFTITILWTEKGDAFNDPNCPAGTPTSTRCFVTTITP